MTRPNISIALSTLLALTVLLELLLVHHERWPGYFGLFGLGSAGALVLAKLALGRILSRPEDRDDR